MAITRRCRYSFITACVCKFVIGILECQEGTSHLLFFYFVCTGRTIPALYRTSVAGRCTCTWASSEESTNTSTSCLTTSTSLSFQLPSTPPWWRYTSLLSGHSAVLVKKNLNRRSLTAQRWAFTEHVMHLCLDLFSPYNKHFPALKSRLKKLIFHLKL